MIRSWLCVLGLAFLTGCPRAPIKGPEEAMRVAKEPPLALVDDMGFYGLAEALAANVRHLKTAGHVPKELRFGPFVIETAKYIESLEVLIARLQEDPSGQTFVQTLTEYFVTLEVYGSKDWAEIFVTSYFEPMIEGSLKRTKKFTQPIYGVPADLVVIKMREFARKFPTLKEYQEKVLEQKSRDGALRGRLVKIEDAGDGGAAVPTVVPYWERQEIDSPARPLRRVAKILAWVDPVDAFFLQIQGSGKIKIGNEKILRVGYAAQNGHPYVAIGQYLFDKIPREKMSQQKIEKYLRSVSAEERQRILNLNPSYVFFTEIDGEPRSFFGTEVVPGRTVATDQKFFPKGALAFLEYEKPSFNSPEDDEAASFARSTRFVLDQDTGGAIRGPHRLDLYWGSGREAAQVSGVMRNPGKLYYFFPKAYLPR